MLSQSATIGWLWMSLGTFGLLIVSAFIFMFAWMTLPSAFVTGLWMAICVYMSTTQWLTLNMDMPDDKQKRLIVGSVLACWTTLGLFQIPFQQESRYSLILQTTVFALCCVAVPIWGIIGMSEDGRILYLSKQSADGPLAIHNPTSASVLDLQDVSLDSVTIHMNRSSNVDATQSSKAPHPKSYCLEETHMSTIDIASMVRFDSNGDMHLDPRRMMSDHGIHATVTVSPDQTRPLSIQWSDTEQMNGNVSASSAQKLWSMYATIPVLSILLTGFCMCILWSKYLPLIGQLIVYGLSLGMMVAIGASLGIYMWCFVPTQVIRMFQLNYTYLYAAILHVLPYLFWAVTWKAYLFLSCDNSVIENQDICDLTDAESIMSSAVRTVWFTVITQLFWMLIEFVISRMHVFGLRARYMFPTQLCIAFLQYMMFGLTPWSNMFIVQVVWIEVQNMLTVAGVWERIWSRVQQCRTRQNEEQMWSQRNAWERLQQVMLWKYRIDLYVQDIAADWLSRGLIWFLIAIQRQRAMQDWKLPVSVISLDMFNDHVTERWITLVVAQIVVTSIGFLLIRKWMTRDLIAAHIQPDTLPRLLQSLGYPPDLQAVIVKHFHTELGDLFTIPIAENVAQQQDNAKQLSNKWLTHWAFAQQPVYYLVVLCMVVGVWMRPKQVWPGIM